MKNIAVQRDLAPIKDYLTDKGYNVQEFEENASQVMNHNVDAIVVTGQDQNMMGIETTSTKVPIIDARGMNPQQVERMLNNR